MTSIAIPALPQPAIRRALRDALIILGLAFFAFELFVIGPNDKGIGSDAYAYWAINPAAPYALREGAIGAFPYAPPMVRLFQPFSLLSWPEFWTLWMAILVGTVIWLGGRRVLWVLAFPPVAFELYHGNVNLLIAAAIALGFRYPATWAFVLLTKVTPGVGLLWFLVRREWRPLLIALGVTAAIVAVSYAVDGSLWPQWLGMLHDASAAPASELGGPLGIPLLIRLPAAAALIAWGGWSDRRWTVPVGATLAMPVLFIAVFSVLTALVAIDRVDSPRRTTTNC
jgi:Glycosyltransferase family 87